ncbi:MAG: trypsin-like peptidase domain-containing protein [Clostridia bacterium]|nr:trypsin-like peptidase domain-containing protein [Clostridia bacterium]
MKKNRVPALIALAVVCVMLGSAVGMTMTREASAEETKIVVTSPFTEAIAQVRESVVGVNNYQTVRYSNYNNNDWTSYFDDFFGFGFGGNGRYGNDRGNFYGDDSASTQEVLKATGSGVVVANGYVLTNYHVVEDATSLKVSVYTEGTDEPALYDATAVAYDSNVDIAVLSVPELKIAPVTLGDSDTLQVGDWAICIGNPLSETFTRTVTAGIVSGLNRDITSTNYDKYGRRETVTNTMIQTDAAINNGNSGGGMFSVTGELMGIPTLKYSGSAYSTQATIEGIGMCIPINAAKPLIEDVLNDTVDAEHKAKAAEKAQEEESTLVGKPRMGITVTSVNTSHSLVKDGTIPNGVYVSEVEAGGPAAIAGMQADDIIVEMNGTVITSVSQMQEIVGAMKEGDLLNVKVFRIKDKETYDGEYVDLEVVLAIVDAVAQ